MDNTLNAIALHELARHPITQDMISYVSSFAATITQRSPSDNLPCNCGCFREDISSPTGTLCKTAFNCNAHIISLEDFIAVLLRASESYVTTLMGALVYMVRLKSKLQPGVKGRHTTNHRIFLASLILASKYFEDEALMNKHWALITCMEIKGVYMGFDLKEINLIEKQFLHLLGWELHITPEDLYIVFKPFLNAVYISG
ncbi:hypothetical protein IWW34DRAFT_634451 [Fusarium oxysporum f. sp. albedinis]|nr:hypothetical protein IWW34DRAFT_634451 [Fusarium oxysporum f. sp. albedinis]